MSETILKVLLSELKTVRITCKNPDCGAVLETPLSSLERYLPSGVCRYCNKALLTGNENMLTTLARTIQALAAATGQVEVEFVLPVKKDE